MLICVKYRLNKATLNGQVGISSCSFDSVGKNRMWVGTSVFCIKILRNDTFYMCILQKVMIRIVAIFSLFFFQSVQDPSLNRNEEGLSRSFLLFCSTGIEKQLFRRLTDDYNKLGKHGRPVLHANGNKNLKVSNLY